MDEQQDGELAWCYYRNLVHTCYREIRHVGTSTDPSAKLVIPDEEYPDAAARIRDSRQTLKGTSQFGRIRFAASTAEVQGPYEQITGLTFQQMSTLFDRDGWSRSYGGRRWKQIADLTARLGTALDDSDFAAARTICDEVRIVSHNSGRLVPRTDDEWNREKWPVLCDQSGHDA